MITAAHCVDCRTKEDTAVIFGTNKPFESIRKEEFKFLSNIFVHPDYKRGVKLELKNSPDIALIELEQEVEFGPTINAICLPSRPCDRYEKKTMLVAGWGLIGQKPNGDPEISEQLMKTRVKVLSNQECRTRNGHDFLKVLDNEFTN